MHSCRWEAGRAMRSTTFEPGFKRLSHVKATKPYQYFLYTCQARPRLLVKENLPVRMYGSFIHTWSCSALHPNKQQLANIIVAITKFQLCENCELLSSISRFQPSKFTHIRWLSVYKVWLMGKLLSFIEKMKKICTKSMKLLPNTLPSNYSGKLGTLTGDLPRQAKVKNCWCGKILRQKNCKIVVRQNSAAEIF
jgi:hypothetical protein